MGVGPSVSAGKNSQSIVVVCGWTSAVPFIVATGELAGDTMDNDDAVVHAAFSPDTNIVATANYDGTNKHETHVEDDAFIGTNSTLIAPVRVEKGAFVAAGSTITDDVPAEGLAIARGRQVVKEGRAPHRKKK